MFLDRDLLRDVSNVQRKLDHGFLVLPFVKVCDGALAMLSLLGFGGLRAAAEGEDER